MPSSSKNFPLSLSNVLSRFTRRRIGNYRRSLSSCGTSCGNIPEPSLCHTGSQAPAQRCNHLRIQITSHEVPHPHWDKNTSPSAAAQPPAAFPSLSRRATCGGDTELILYLSRACPAAISSPNQVTVPQGRHAETPEPSPPLQDAVLRGGGQRARGKGKRVWGEE